MEVEVFLENVIAWIDALLNDPNATTTLDRALTTVDAWLKADIAARNHQPAAPATYSTPASSEQTSGQAQGIGKLPRILRGKMSSTHNMDSGS